MTGDNGWKTCDCPGPTDNEITLEWLADNSILIFIKCYIQKLIKLSPFIFVPESISSSFQAPPEREHTQRVCANVCNLCIVCECQLAGNRER